jgi:hypothetical protein
VLREAIGCAALLGYEAPAQWTDIATRIVVPLDERRGVILDHDDFDPSEEKGATPAALAGLFPFGYQPGGEIERATIAFYLDLADEYVGSPMLSALYGAWAARLGDRGRSAELFEEGYAKFVSERFLNTHEYRDDKFPEQTPAGPFSANLGGFLLACLYGLTGLRPNADIPQSWADQPIVMPAAWDAIEVERVWIRGRPARLVARHGDARATITFTDE